MQNQNLTPVPQKKRLDYLDIAKAITIFLVIMGHAGDNAATYYYRRVLYSFHMPLFFMVSGVVSERHRKGYSTLSWKKFLKKNLLALAVPFLLWALIYCQFSYQNVLRILYGSWEMLGQAGTLTSLWYLSCLLVARIALEGVLQLSMLFKTERHLFAAAFCPIPFLLAFLLPRIAVGYPWCANVSMAALGFLLLGYAGKEYLAELTDKPCWLHGIFLVLYAAMFVGGLVKMGDSLPLMRMCATDYGNPMCFFWFAFSGSGLVLSISILIAKLFRDPLKPRWYGAVTWIGKNTMGIFLLHKPFLQQVVMPLLARIGVTTDNAPGSFIASVITIACCCFGVMGLKKVLPQALGIFPSKKPVKKAEIAGNK